jgi:glycogen debranching enzyme
MRPLGQLEHIARQSLTANIHKMAKGWYLTAGAHQFISLWTRDFCFSSRGLFRLGKFQVVYDQLELIISKLEIGDGFALVPKVMDSSSFVRQFRAVSPIINKCFGISQNVPLDEPLRAEYEDERGSVAVDSNMLVLLTAYDYFVLAGAGNWWKRRLKDLVHIYKYYDQKHIKDGDGLIVQPPFSDWQDSVRRAGKRSMRISSII